MKNLPELSWIAEARKHVGLREIKGPKHNQTILLWLQRLGAWWREDETPWCGVFIAQCLQSVGMTRGPSTGKAKPMQYPYNWYRALAYQTEGGVELDKPAYGCVAVKTRKGGGHVCFVVGKTAKGALVCLGGNQSDMVCYAVYKKSDFSSFMWYGATTRPAEGRYDLPLIANVTATKVTES